MTLIGPILLQVRRLTAVARLRPFDTSTEAGRSNERHRRIVLSTAGAVAARVVNIISIFAIVGMTVPYLGNDRYGLWMTLTSVLGFATFADLGVLQGLTTLLAQTHGQDDDRDTRGATAASYVSGAFLILSVAAGVLILGFAAVFPFVNWGAAMGAETEAAARDAAPAMFVLTVCTLATLPLSLAQSVRLGYQQQYICSLWQAVGSLVGLGATVVGVRIGVGLVTLATIPLAVLALQYLADSVLLFVVQRPSLRPRLARVTRGTLRILLRFGLLFMILAITRAVGMSSDALVLAKILGTSSVTQYSVPQRLFAITPLLLTFVLAPLWPAYAEAMGRGDLAWVRNTLHRSVKLTIAVVVPMAVFLILFGGRITRLWVGGAVEPSLSLLIGLGLASTTMGLGGVPAMFLNGMGVVRFQIIVAVVMSIVNLGLSIVLTRMIGVAGVAYGTGIANLACVIIPSYIYITRLLPRLGEHKPLGANGSAAGSH